MNNNSKTQNVIRKMSACRQGKQNDLFPTFSVLRSTFNGFTLIELLVVITILGVLSSIGLGNFMNSQMKGRDTQRKSDLHQLQNALELFYNDKGKYPKAGGNQILGCPAQGSFSAGCETFSFSNPACDLNGDGRVSIVDNSIFVRNAGTGRACSWGGNSVFTDGKTTYLQKVPADPKGTLPYCYKASSDQAKYQLFAKLENTNDTDIITGVTLTCGGNTYNFGAASSNTNLGESL